MSFESTITTMIGLLGGMALTVIFWYFTTHFLVPQLAFSPKISKRFTMQGNPVYELRVKNVSRRRGVVDLSVGVMLRATGLKMFPASRGNTTILLPVWHYAHSILRLVPDKGFRVIRLDLNETFRTASAHHRHTFSMDRYDPTDKNPLEYLLAQGKGGKLIVEILGYDEWSGSRKCFQSLGYGVGSIVHGQFEGLNIIPFSEDERKLIPTVQIDKDATLRSLDISSRSSEDGELQPCRLITDAALVRGHALSGRGALLFGGLAFGLGVLGAVRLLDKIGFTDRQNRSQ